MSTVPHETRRTILQHLCLSGQRTALRLCDDVVDGVVRVATTRMMMMIMMPAHGNHDVDYDSGDDAVVVDDVSYCRCWRQG